MHITGVGQDNELINGGKKMLKNLPLDNEINIMSARDDIFSLTKTFSKKRHDHSNCAHSTYKAHSV